ncbi:MAG: hypothetical protein ACOCYT_02765 [Chloroflexota bacterium]
MGRLAQVGIAIGALGAVLMLMGLFPGVTGLDPTPGIGITQIFAILIGFSWFIFGALIYVKYTFYIHSKANLVQQIGTRLSMTGLVLAAMAGLADALGYGSHGGDFSNEFVLGRWQATGIIVSYVISCLGVLVYAIGGTPLAESPRSGDDEETQTPKAGTTNADPDAQGNGPDGRMDLPTVNTVNEDKDVLTVQNQDKLGS